MGSVLKFEAARLFHNKNNLIVCFCLLVAALYFVNQGIVEYKGFVGDKEIFFDYEKSRLEKYVTWDQYGINGFGLLYEPSPLTVLRGISFSSSDNTVFLFYWIYALAFLTFFYFLGVLTASIFRSKKILIILLLWLVSVFAVPRIMSLYLANEAE